jgi:hypothetical protein
MNKLDGILLRIFIYEVPILLIWFISIFMLGLAADVQNNFYAEIWYDFGGCFILSSWMIITIYLSIRLIISDVLRDKILSKLILLRESDEREVKLTGEAAKTTMLTTMAVLILLFCLSCFQFSVSNLPTEQIIDGKTREISLGLSFNASEQQAANSVQGQVNNIISYSGLPISNTMLIIGIIGWQVVSYNYAMKHKLK